MCSHHYKALSQQVKSITIALDPRCARLDIIGPESEADEARRSLRDVALKARPNERRLSIFSKYCI
jgi:hypothetical protein